MYVWVCVCVCALVPARARVLVCVCLRVCVSVYEYYYVIHSVVCLTTVPEPLPKQVLRRARYGASFLKFQFILFSLLSSSSCLPPLARLPVTSTFPSTFPLIMCFRRKSLRKLRPIQLAFLGSIVYRMFLSHLSLCNASYFTRYVQLIFSVPLRHHV